MMNSKATGCIWLVAGPVVSILVGYALFLFLAFVIGAGNDLEHSGTQFEKAMTHISLPVWAVIFIGGSAVSIFRLFAKSPCVKGRAMESRVQGVMKARMNIRN